MKSWLNPEGGKGWLLLFLFYLLVAIFITFPYILHLYREIPGDAGHIDQSVRVWQMWWMNFAARHHLPLFYSPYLYHPFGLDLLAYMGGYFDLLYFIPSTFLLPPLLANNLLILIFGIVFTGIAGYILTRYVTGNRLTGLLGGVVIATCPYMYHHSLSSHTEQTELGPLILAIYFFLFSLEAPLRFRKVLLTSLFVLLTYLCYMVYAIFAIMVMALLSLLLPAMEYFKGGKNLFPSHIRTLLLTLATSLVLIGPMIFFFARSYRGFEYAGDFILPERIKISAPVAPDMGETPLFGFLAHESLGEKTVRSSIPLRSLLRWNLLLVVPPAAFLVFLAIRSGGRRRGLYISLLMIGLVFFILSLGPYLKLDEPLESVTSIPLPYLLLYNFFPFFIRFNHPDRMMILFTIPVAILASCGATYLLERMRPGTPLLRHFAAVFLYLALLKIVYMPFITTPLPPVPEFYREIEGEGDIALIDLPFSFSLMPVSIYPFFYQVYHEKRTLDGIPHSYNITGEFKEFFSSNAILHPLAAICDGMEEPGSMEMWRIEEARGELLGLGFRYILLHRTGGLRDERIYTRLENFLDRELGPPLRRYEGGMTVWTLRRN